jgi:hypothetical protein
VNWSEAQQSVTGFDLVKEGIASSQYDNCIMTDLWLNTTKYFTASA